MSQPSAAISTIGTNDVKHVLNAFINEFLVDVPAIHRDGQYLIEVGVLEDHIRGLDYEDLVQISIEASEVALGG